MIVDVITKYLNENEVPAEALAGGIIDDVKASNGHAFQRQFIDPPTKSKLRLSSSGTCYKKQWYIHKDTEQAGKGIDARAKIVFHYGDQIEITVANLAKIAGVNITNIGLDQLTVKLKLEDGSVIDGHPDGVVNGDTLFECKSMNEFGFRDFTKGKIDEAYITQIQTYMGLLKLEKCCFVAFNKQSGYMEELIIRYDEKIFQQAQANLYIAMQDKEPEPPTKYNPDAKGFYPWQCMYCAYYEKCRPNAEKVVVSGRYKLKEKKV